MEDEGMAELRLESIFKTYDKQLPAVNNFTLHIEDKEFIVLVGPSGCGKTTTLRMMAGLEEISSGDFYIDGKRMNHIPAKDRDIAMVFQNYALYPHMTVFENLAFGLKLRKLPTAEIQQRVKKSATLLGLEDCLTRKPKALSGGQRQRVALGRAIVRDAKVFLMDEPLSNLDAKLRVQMRTEITKLHQRLQTTTIYVTHDQTEAMTMATRLVVMKDGIIQQVGDPKEVYEHPENMFVASFIGSPGMNLIKGQLEDGLVRFGTVALIIPEQKMSLLRQLDYVGKAIILGIRPEDVYSEPFIKEENNSSRLSVAIEVLELTGADTLLYTKIANQELVARLDSTIQCQPGEYLELKFDMNRVHFFDPNTQQRIRS
jgi:multiple sugar transport system ATP-binding protein